MIQNSNNQICKCAPETQQLDFPRDEIFNIGGTRFVIQAHFDDRQEALPDKLTRLLKKEAANCAFQTGQTVKNLV